MSLPIADQLFTSMARLHQARLTKPLGSLGRLEDLAVQIAGYQASATPEVDPCAALIFASDHPVTRHGVTPYPSEVTRAMLLNFASGGAAASVLAKQHRVPLHIFDVGVNGDAPPPHQNAADTSEPHLHYFELRVPAGDIRYEDALKLPDFAQCLEFGRTAVEKHAKNTRLVILGEMGIGNTTPAAAIAAYLQGDPDGQNTVGAGTGAQGTILETKRQVVADILRRLPSGLSPLELLRRAGGREIATLYGAMRHALEERKLVLVDGFIVTAVAAALVAAEPAALAGMVFSHCSAERGHRALLAHLGVIPLLQLDMRLGEASGALMALPLLRSACALHNQMATFESAHIPEAQ